MWSCTCICGVGECLWEVRVIVDSVCSSPSTEVDMDVDEFEVGQVDKLNVMALEYGVPAGLFSKWVMSSVHVLYIR